jgi:ABC-type glutathione transport system ATPase component
MLKAMKRHTYINENDNINQSE